MPTVTGSWHELQGTVYIPNMVLSMNNNCSGVLGSYSQVESNVNFTVTFAVTFAVTQLLGFNPPGLKFIKTN